MSTTIENRNNFNWVLSEDPPSYPYYIDNYNGGMFYNNSNCFRKEVIKGQDGKEYTLNVPTFPEEVFGQENFSSYGKLIDDESSSNNESLAIQKIKKHYRDISIKVFGNDAKDILNIKIGFLTKIRDIKKEIDELRKTLIYNTSKNDKKAINGIIQYYLGKISVYREFLNAIDSLIDNEEGAKENDDGNTI